MNERTPSSRAACAYCGTHARPNAMYCMNCGQIVDAPRDVSGMTASHPVAPADAQSHAAAHSHAHSNSLPAWQPPAAQQAARAVVTPPRLPVLPMPSVPASARTPLPAREATSTYVAPPPLPKLASSEMQLIELVFPSGERTTVHSTAVLGRGPEATARNSGAQAIVVPDETKSVSRAHAIIELQGRAAAISDAGSANGSAVVRDGSVLELTNGRQISLRGGDSIRLGDVLIEVHINHASRGGQS